MSATNQNGNNNGTNELTVSPDGVSLRVKSSIMFIVIAMLLIIGHGVFSYNKKGSWTYDLFKTDKLQTVSLKELHKPVTKLIYHWNRIESLQSFSEEVSFITTESGPLLKSYSDFRIANFSNKLKASYLYHLGQLRIINTDVTRLPDEIFIAIRNLEEAKAIVTSGKELSPDEIQFFEKMNMNGRIEHSLINAYIFAYLTTGIQRYKDTFMINFKRLGGCDFFKHKKVLHKDILKVAGCPSYSE